jgi:hypothetical protein
VQEVVATDGDARRRTRLVGAIVAVCLIVLVGAFLLVPRTIAAGGEGDTAWRVRVAPLGPRLGPNVTVETAWAGGIGVGDRWRPPHRLDDTVAVLLDPLGGDDETLIVGPTPRHTDSVRVTTEVHGVGEARSVRVGWTDFHVARLGGRPDEVELVAISDRGAVIEVARVTAAVLPSS